MLSVGKSYESGLLTRYDQSLRILFTCSLYAKYLIPIVGLFDGRIVDLPERLMMSSSYFSRGEIEHTVSVLLNICPAPDK